MNENELMNEAARELNEINESDVVNVTAASMAQPM